MELTEFTVRLLILGLPGILCFFIYQRLTGRKTDSQIIVILIIFCFSILCYGLLGFVQAIWNWFLGNGFNQNIVDRILFSKNPGFPNEIFFAIVTGIFLAYALSFGHRKQLINKIGQRIRVTNHYGDEDVWDYFHNAPTKWVVIRDHKTGLDYYGYISVWSDPRAEREMIISDATVFRDGEELYKVNQVYLSRQSNEFSIEVPSITNEKKEK